MFPSKEVMMDWSHIIVFLSLCLADPSLESVCDMFNFMHLTTFFLLF
jgi:hypothetical protein